MYIKLIYKPQRKKINNGKKLGGVHYMGRLYKKGSNNRVD